MATTERTCCNHGIPYRYACHICDGGEKPEWKAVYVTETDSPHWAVYDKYNMHVVSGCIGKEEAELIAKAPELEEENERLKTEVARMKEELQTPNVLTCVYCGQAYPQGTPTHGSQVLTDHIKVCEKHPMRKSEEENKKLRDQLEQAKNALRANRVFHTPIALRRRGGQWDEYEMDAIKRTQEIVGIW